MKVLITGAAGLLGSVACRVLHEAGLELIATDRVAKEGSPVPIHVADLCDASAVKALVAGGVDAVVHLATLGDQQKIDPYVLVQKNVAMTMNVFQAGVEAGAKKVLFASSIQVIATAVQWPQRDPDERPPYLPMDAEMPEIPQNPYAMSKEAGEVITRYFARVYGVQAITVRWPWMFPMETMRDRTDAWEKTNPFILQLGFSYLSLEDASRLILAILRTDLPGYRVYMPASKKNMLGRPVGELIREYYPNVPLRRPIEKIDCLVDISRIERETGWSPTM